MKKQLYFEALLSGLIPVQHPYRLPAREPFLPTLWGATVSEDTKGYRKGMIVVSHARHFVYKDKVREGFQYVREANLGRLAGRRSS